MIKYAGIGARKDVPEHVKKQCELIGMLLAARGFQLNSGQSGDCDLAFETGALNQSGAYRYRVPTLWEPALIHAARYHFDRWSLYDEAEQARFASLSMIIHGDHFDDPVHFIVCYHPGETVPSVAEGFPVFNLFDDPGAAKLWAWIGAQGW